MHVQVTWRRLGAIHPMTIGESTFVTDWRVTVEAIHRNDEWNLVISDVQYEDEGTYQCQINTKDDQSNFYNIYVHVKSRCSKLSSFIFFVSCDFLFFN